MKFQDKFYDIIGHNKCPSSEKSAEKCILRKSYFHRILPNYAVTKNMQIVHMKALKVHTLKCTCLGWHIYDLIAGL